MDMLVIPVEGMTCGGCVRSVQRALVALPGVDEATAELTPGQVTVLFDGRHVAAEQLKGAIEGAGFDVPTDWRPTPNPA